VLHDPAQGGVARGVAGGLVDGTEVVEVEQDDRAVAAPRQERVERPVEGGTAQRAGEPVVIGVVAGLVEHRAQLLGDAPAHEQQRGGEDDGEADELQHRVVGHRGIGDDERAGEGQGRAGDRGRASRPAQPSGHLHLWVHLWVIGTARVMYERRAVGAVECAEGTLLLRGHAQH
jgi:hypothetical protein